MTATGSSRQHPPAAAATRRRAAARRRRGRRIYAAAAVAVSVVFLIALGPRAGIAAGLGGLAVYAAARYACSPPPTDPRNSGHKPGRRPRLRQPAGWPAAARLTRTWSAKEKTE